MKLSGEFLMTSLQENKSKGIQSIQWLKLVNHTSEQRKKWSYGEKCCSKRGDEFDLHWALNKNQKETLTQNQLEKASERKRKDAFKAQKGDLILLCQNHRDYGHRVTHIVKVISLEAEWKDNYWARHVQAIWTPSNDFESWKDKAPVTKSILGENFSFRSGNLVRSDTLSARLNLSFLE